MTSAQANLNQVIQTGLFEELKPVVVLGPVVELSFEEKVLRAVEAIKQQVREGRHLVVAWSAGKIAVAF